MFAAAGWGWHIETAVHLIRMILGGVFDRYPKLQVVIGHLGEGVPFMLPRLNKNLPTEMTKLARPLGAYLRENVHYTFGGFNFPATFLDLLLEVGVERIMFSVDHPYGSMAEARAFLEHLPVSAGGPGAHRARQRGAAVRAVAGRSRPGAKAKRQAAGRDSMPIVRSLPSRSRTSKSRMP